ncbi:MAG: hypothetical protein ABGY96_17770 [bacterium]|nr:hypothetical protein [Gammaproteobacteria bacterium]
MVDRQKKSPVDQYLASHGEPETLSLAKLDLAKSEPGVCKAGPFRFCLVIPAFQEDWQELQLVWKQLNRDCLIIIVANSAVEDDPVTRKLIKDIESESASLSSNEALTCLKTRDQRTLVLVDRCTHPVPEKQGVGLARKIGADIALTLINKHQVTTPWIFTTDADVRLPASYFDGFTQVDRQAPGKDVAARIYPFTHYSATETREACTLYEIALHYYVCGLRYASSPYAFTTVGSTIAISARHYAQVRGFPKRSAGEDFYLLNKLAKTGSVDQLTEPRIEISGRLSRRVPFGTGVSIGKILQLASPASDYRYYNPAIFHCLKQFLFELNQSRSASDLKNYFSDSRVRPWCEAANLFVVIESKQNQKPEVFQKFIHDWMDSFRTLKLVHFLQEHYFPGVSLGGIFDGAILPPLGEVDLSDLTKLKKLVTTDRQPAQSGR